MGTTATINARIPESLKEHGSQILERDGVSPTELIRSVYRYMEKEQRIPECLDVSAAGGTDAFEKRRAIARSLRGTVRVPDGIDLEDLRAQRIGSKYEGLLHGDSL